MPQLTQEKLRRGFGKNAGEWTGRVEISKEEIPGNKRSMHGYVLPSVERGALKLAWKKSQAARVACMAIY